MSKLICAALLAVALAPAGCSKDPNDYSTWTAKLKEPRESERAVTQLEQLGDPRAIPALGEAWNDQGKPPHLLEVIISLARPLTAAEADAKSVTDFDGKDGRPSGRPESWAAAAPFLIAAITNVDESNPHQVDSAAKAAGALGESKLSQGLDALIELSGKPQTKKLMPALVESVRAIGKFDTEKPKAAGALIKLVDTDPPQNPMKVKDHSEQRAAAEKYAIYQGITSQAINGLGDLRSPTATKALVLSLYRAPDLFTMSRRALVAIGPDAEKALSDTLLGTNADVNQLFKDKRLDRYCGDKGDATGDQCQPVSARDYSAAVVLGDFYDPKSVPALLAALTHPPLPVAYQDDQPTPNTQYNAIFAALRKVGSAEAAPAVRALWEGKALAGAPKGPAPKGAPPPSADSTNTAPLDPATRALAVNAYPFVSHDGAGADELGAIAADNKAEDGLRQEAAQSYARLATDAKAADVMNTMAQKYFDASAKKRTEADGKPKADSDAADKDLEAARKARDTAKQDALRATHDNSKTADDIRKAVDASKKAEDEYKTANTKHKAATAPYKALDRQAKDYKSFARMFQTHIARIEVAVRCKTEMKCYAATLTETPEDAAKNCAPYIKDIKDWTPEEKLGLLDGEVERAMLEIGKQGAKAQDLTETLLDNAKSDDRIIRESILLALPKVAKVPCESCLTKLQVAIKAGEGKSTLGDLNLQTTMMLNYFSWAGGRVPKAPSAEAPADAPAPAAPAAPAPAKAAPAPAKAAPAKAAPPKKK